MRGTPGFVPDSPEQIAAKQAKLRGDAPEPAPAPADAAESESGLPPGYVAAPKTAPKFLTGRIREEWKRNSQ